MKQATRFGHKMAGGLCLVGILLTAGCGGDSKAVVSGKVLYQGKPIRGGNVAFVPQVGGAISSPIEEDGSYTIRNVPPGTVKITVETNSMRPPDVPNDRGRGGPSESMMKFLKEKDPQRANSQRVDRYVPIPPQYSDPAKTTLTFDVKKGKQEHDIDLK